MYPQGNRQQDSMGCTLDNETKIGAILDHKIGNVSPDSFETGDGLFEQLKFNSHGLIPAIVQDVTDGAVLMMAWMDREALERTLATGDVWFYSRSRNRHWRKGEESANTLHAVEVCYDCDGDTLLLKCQIGGEGVACHTGARTCFYRTLPIERSSHDG